jgi:hypothetical protein
VIEVSLSPAEIQAGRMAELEVSLANPGPGSCTNVIFTLRLPAGLRRLLGRERIEIGRLDPGQSHRAALRVLARQPGSYRLTSSNFSYRDPHGRPYRDYTFAADVIVTPAPAPQSAPEPELSTELRTQELPLDNWSSLRGRIINHGPVDVFDLAITVSGPVIVDQRAARVRLEALPAGQATDVTFFVRAHQPGQDVPVHLELSYRDQRQRHHSAATHSIRVLTGQVAAAPAWPGQRPSQVRILFLASEPADQARLWLGGEIREIQQAIRAGRDRDKFEISIRTAVRPADISQALLDVEPRIVHFAGHGGGPEGSFVAEDETRLGREIPVAGLAHLFRTAGRGVECVIVNACRTERLARALADYVRYTIGTRQPVGDRSAILFSVGFYQALAAGRPIEDAFDLGLAQIMMAGGSGDQAAPLLLTRAPAAGLSHHHRRAAHPRAET